MNFKFLYTDDKTGKFSGTTLRTWILFFVFLAVALLIGGAAVLVAFGSISMKDIPSGVVSFFSSLGAFCLGGQVFYLGKRFMEHNSPHPVIIVQAMLFVGTVYFIIDKQQYSRYRKGQDKPGREKKRCQDVNDVDFYSVHIVLLTALWQGPRRPRKRTHRGCGQKATGFHF